MIKIPCVSQEDNGVGGVIMVNPDYIIMIEKGNEYVHVFVDMADIINDYPVSVYATTLNMETLVAMIDG